MPSLVEPTGNLLALDYRALCEDYQSTSPPSLPRTIHLGGVIISCGTRGAFCIGRIFTPSPILINRHDGPLADEGVAYLSGCLWARQTRRVVGLLRTPAAWPMTTRPRVSAPRQR